MLIPAVMYLLPFAKTTLNAYATSARNSSALSRRLEEIDRMLAAPETAADMNLFRDLSRERGEIEPIVGRLHAYERAESDLAAAQELAADPEMKAFAAEESAAATHELERIEQELRIALLPKDPNDDRNIFFGNSRRHGRRRISTLCG